MCTSGEGCSGRGSSPCSSLEAPFLEGVVGRVGWAEKGTRGKGVRETVEGEKLETTKRSEQSSDMTPPGPGGGLGLRGWGVPSGWGQPAHRMQMEGGAMISAKMLVARSRPCGDGGGPTARTCEGQGDRVCRKS